MTTAVIGTGGLGSVIARELASGGETLRLSSADHESARTLAARIGRAAVVAAGNRDALQGADAVVLALRFTVLKGVIDEIADPLTDKLVVVPSNPLTIDAQGNLSRVLPEGQSSGKVVARVVAGGGAVGHGVRNPVGRSLGVLCQPVTGAGGPVLRDRRRPCWRGSRAVDPNGRLRPGEGRRDRTVGPARGGRRPSRSRSRRRRGAVINRWGLIASPPWPGAPLRPGLRPDGLDGADHRGVERHGPWYRALGGSRHHALSPAPSPAPFPANPAQEGP
jgi:NADP oxidoreductase coenzyme F420-dependent